jgi:hypothetical protein
MQFDREYCAKQIILRSRDVKYLLTDGTLNVAIRQMFLIGVRLAHLPILSNLIDYSPAYESFVMPDFWYRLHGTDGKPGSYSV